AHAEDQAPHAVGDELRGASAGRTAARAALQVWLRAACAFLDVAPAPVAIGAGGDLADVHAPGGCVAQEPIELTLVETGGTCASVLRKWIVAGAAPARVAHEDPAERGAQGSRAGHERERQAPIATVEPASSGASGERAARRAVRGWSGATE